MTVHLSVWDKLSRVVIVLLFLAGLTAVFFWYLPLIQQNQRYRKRIFELDTRILEQEKLGRHLRASIESMQTDPRMIERLARERLGWARTNETVIRCEPGTPPRREQDRRRMKLAGKLNRKLCRFRPTKLCAFD